MADPSTRSPSPAEGAQRGLSRRQVLGGMAGVAGLAAVPSLLAACSTPASSAPSASSGGGGSASAGPSAAGGGEITLGSNYSDTLPKGVLAGIVDTFTKNTGTKVT